MLSQKLVTKCRGSFFGDTFYSIYSFITWSTIRNRGRSHWSFVSLFRHEQGEREPRQTALERYKANTRFKYCCIRGSSVANLSSRAARKSRSPWIPLFWACAEILGNRRDSASWPWLSADYVQNQYIWSLSDVNFGFPVNGGIQC